MQQMRNHKSGEMRDGVERREERREKIKEIREKVQATRVKG